MALNVDAIRAVLAAGHPGNAVVGVTIDWLQAAAPLLGITVPATPTPIPGILLDVTVPIAGTITGEPA